MQGLFREVPSVDGGPFLGFMFTTLKTKTYWNVTTEPQNGGLFGSDDFPFQLAGS